MEPFSGSVIARARTSLGFVFFGVTVSWGRGAAITGKELRFGCAWLPRYQVQAHHANRRYNDGGMGAGIRSEDVERGVAVFLTECLSSKRRIKISLFN